MKQRLLDSRRTKVYPRKRMVNWIMCADSVKPKIIIICGPTALGKTSIAINVAGIFNGEIISADSMQIYRYMDIGTAKPTTDEQSCVAHHMIDIIDPDEHFDARQFAEIAYEKIIRLYASGVIPFVFLPNAAL